MLLRRLVVFSCGSLMLLVRAAQAQPSVVTVPPAATGPDAPAALPDVAASPAAPPAPSPSPNDAPPSYLQPGRYTPPAFISEPTQLPTHLNVAPAWRLRKSDVVETILRRNLGLQIERENVHTSQLSEQASQGGFEPIVSASYRHRDSDSPPSNTQEGSAGQIINNVTNSWDVGAAKRFETGTRTDLSLNHDWSRSSLGNAISPDLFRSSVDLTVSQPLLRGFSTDGEIQTAPILRAKFGSKRAMEEARVRAASTIVAAENAYWDLTEALKSYQVRVRSWELGKQQLQLTERQIQAGVLPPSDLINAEGTLARRELELVEAESRIEQTGDRLREVMNLPNADWKKPLLTQEAPTFVGLRPDVPRLIAQAQRERPELAQTKLTLRQASLDQHVADNAKLPDLSASLSYGLVGQASTFSGSVSEVGEARGRYWSTFVNLSWTPLNQQSSAEAERANVTRRRATIEKNQLLLSIQVEVRQAARSLETAEKQLYAAAKSRSLSERSLDAEQRKFQNGMSSNFFVAQRQEELAQAQLAELSALIRHEKARTGLQLSTGELLQRRNVKLDLGAP